MEFSFHQTYEGEKSLGFITPTKPKKGIPITDCLMIHKDAMEILRLTRSWWKAYPELQAYYPPKNKGSLCTLTIRIGGPEKGEQKRGRGSDGAGGGLFCGPAPCRGGHQLGAVGNRFQRKYDDQLGEIYQISPPA